MRQLLRERQYCYQQTFKGVYGQAVLKDLARFCRAHESTFNEGSDRASALAEGRREVWLRLQHHLQLTPDQLWELYSGRPAQDD